MLGAVILQIILIALNAVFACAEIAVLSMSDVKLESMSKEGDRSAKRLMALTKNPAKFLSTIQVAITLAGFLGSAFASENFVPICVNWLTGLGVTIPENILKTICVCVITLIMSYFSIVFGELIPKRVAMKKTESVSLALSGILTIVAQVFRPIVWLLTISTNGLLRLIGINPEEEEQVTEEEIRMMVAAGSEKGTIDTGENEMIQNVFEFNDTPVEEVCTHRVDVDYLDIEDDQDAWDECVYSTEHSYYPVCGESSDDIIGILNAKEYLRMKDRTRETVMEKAVRKPFFVPETMKADALFAKMKKSGNYFAIVVDEYGGMSGIATMRDLVELLVGELAEGEEDHVEDIVALGTDEWKIQGTASLDDVAEALDVELPVEEYDTFSGYICGTLGEVPDDGVTFDLETDDLKIQVQKVQDRRIEEAFVFKKKKPEEEEEA